MGNEVYANGREIACKASGGKSICAFPDVCFTPPQTPATPPGVPIPYPNTGMAGDMTKGSKNVKISKKEIMLKNKSYFKKSTGDEAGSAPKKGIVTSKIKGKVYFTMWSMNVKVEGENVVRHLDMTTHNHGSNPPNTPPWPFVAKMAMGVPLTEKDPCKADAETENDACKNLIAYRMEKGKTVVNKSKTKANICGENGEDCRNARKCRLAPQDEGMCCKNEQQAHHLVEAHCFYDVGGRGDESKLFVKQQKGKDAYVDKKAPCVCASGPRHDKEHGTLHAFQGQVESAYHDKKKSWNYQEARDAGAKAHKTAYPQCDEKCIKSQLDEYHDKKCGVNENTELRTDPKAGSRSAGKLSNEQERVLEDTIAKVKNEVRQASRK